MNDSGHGCLVISRKRGESVQIGDVRVTVVRVGTKGRIRLSIEAPKNVKIVRTELIPEQQFNT